MTWSSLNCLLWLFYIFSLIWLWFIFWCIIMLKQKKNQWLVMNLFWFNIDIVQNQCLWTKHIYYSHIKEGTVKCNSRHSDNMQMNTVENPQVCSLLMIVCFIAVWKKNNNKKTPMIIQSSGVSNYISMIKTSLCDAEKRNCELLKSNKRKKHTLQ